MEKFDTIDAYIKTFPKDIQKILEKLRETIHQAAPEAFEDMKYGMPTFVYKGKNLVHFAGWESHIGFYPTPGGIDGFKELDKYRTGKGTLQFPITHPIPYTLITKVTKFRIGEIDKKGGNK